MAILIAMDQVTHMPLADVKNRLSEVVDRVEKTSQRLVITKHGRPAAVLISVDELESLEETLDIISNPEVMAEIRDARAAYERGEQVTFEEIKKEFLGGQE